MSETDTSELPALPVSSSRRLNANAAIRAVSVLLVIVLSLIWIVLVGSMVMPAIVAGAKK